MCMPACADMTNIYANETLILKALSKKQIVWHNMNARRLDAPLIQVAGNLFWKDLTGFLTCQVCSNVVKLKYTDWQRMPVSLRVFCERGWEYLQEAPIRFDRFAFIERRIDMPDKGSKDKGRKEKKKKPLHDAKEKRKLKKEKKITTPI